MTLNQIGIRQAPYQFVPQGIRPWVMVVPVRLREDEVDPR